MEILYSGMQIRLNVLAINMLYAPCGRHWEVCAGCENAQELERRECR